MAVYLIFWDGVGCGPRDPAANPFFSADLPALKTLCGAELFSLRRCRVSTHLAAVTPVNATLGMPGLPQSGTGQTALFTGTNAPKIAGRHFGPHPYSTLVPIIKARNIFRRLSDMGATARFANGFPARYIDYLRANPTKVPVVALAYASVNGGLSTHHDVEAGRAISADIIGSRWKELGHERIEPVSAANAGRLFYELGRGTDLILFEYFITDKAGHAQDRGAAIEALERADGFIGGLMERFDFGRDTLLVISDHGNIEDLRTKSHTRNPVPLIAAGKGREMFARRIRRLTDLTPAVASFVAAQRQ